jgi:hypothetical protein
MTEPDANSTITGVDGLVVGTINYDYNDTVAAGLVLSQSPVAGTSVPVGSAVSYTVSLGQPVVPYIIGMTEPDANSTITGVDGLVVGTINYDYNDTVAAGLVLSQSPVAGTSVPVGSAVNYTVSLGAHTRTLTTSSTGGGSVTTPGEPGPYPYNYNEAASIVATPEACYHFVNWTGTGVAAGKVADANAASTTITMDDDYSVQANFVINQYTLTINIVGNGSVTKEPDQATYTCGQIVELTANPDTGWMFSGWSGDLSGITNPVEITMDGNKNITATFALPTEYIWTNESPYSILWVDPLNWDPNVGPPDDCADTAIIGSTEQPTVVVTAVEVGKIRGPVWGDLDPNADHEMLLVGDANLTVCHDWRVEDTLPYTAYITLVDRAKVTILTIDEEMEKSFEAHGNHQSAVISMSDDTEFTLAKDMHCGDGGDDYFELNMTDNAYMYIDDRDDEAALFHAEGELHISLSGNAVLEAHTIRLRAKGDEGVTSTLDVTENAQIIVFDEDDDWSFRFAGGEPDFVINLEDNAVMDLAYDFSGGEDDDHKGTWTLNMPCGDTPLLDIGRDMEMIRDNDSEGFGQVNLHGGTINVEGEIKSDTDNWNIDICCDGLLILGGDVVDDVMDWHESGNITACGFGPCGGPAELVADYDNIIAGKTVVWTEEDPNMPYDPDPPCDNCEDEEAKVPADQCLSWTSGQNPCEGQGELLHYVFLGTDREKVCTGSLSVLVAILPEEQTTYCPGQLELGATYWWKIKEVCPCNETDGDCWCFTVEDCMIVEDMESYNESCDANAIWEVWLDGAGDCNGIGGNGTGSSVYLAYEPVHGGEKSMQYIYDNTGSERECAWSEARKTFDPPLNLVDNFEKAMVLWFYGDAGNDTESMWVVLSDGTNEAQSTYGVYGDSPDDIKVEDWIDWNIDVQSQFPDVNLANVESFSIGFGPRFTCGEHPGEPAGTVYFDDIMLCTTICVPKYAPAGDINDDCIVNWKDLALIADNWLEDRR